MAEASHAVFLSYASQDAEAAQKICGALRAAGIEVWFDQSALRGGDVWDQTIRKQIKTCALFVPVISRHTHERDEGYFRLEWKLAVDRSHLMTSNKAFFLPVVIDDTPEHDENVPDRFREIHWTRLPGGDTPPAFVERVRHLVSPEPSAASAALPATTRAPGVSPQIRGGRRWKQAPIAVGAVVGLGVLAYFAIDKYHVSNHPVAPPPPAAHNSAEPTAFSPPPHSIAVLPFVNMSGDKEQEYFSDGLTEEILNSLARINELQVSARTSSFSFKGKDTDLGTIAHKLNVASILEGSVRRAGNTVRITAQLNNAVTGFHLWSQTYDRDLSDVLKLQTDIANAVANALRVSLLGDVTEKIEVGGTRNPAAFDAYLRGSMAYRMNWPPAPGLDEKDWQAALDGYTEAIRLDSNYALAYADRSIALSSFTGDPEGRWPAAATLTKARADARKAIGLAPGLGVGHEALAIYFETSLAFRDALQEYERAVALTPGDSRILRHYGFFATLMTKTEPGLAAARRSFVLDPLNVANHISLGQSLYVARRYDEAIAALKEARILAPGNPVPSEWLGYAYHVSGDFQSARATCEPKHAGENGALLCLAIIYDKLGEHAKAEEMLGKFRAFAGDSGAVLYAMVYAEWGDSARALDWLGTAMRLHDPLLAAVKTAPPLDPLRKEPRFQAIERELKFPD